MSHQHKLTLAWQKTGDANPISKEIAVTSEGENNIDVQVDDGQTDKAINWTLDFSQLQIFFMVSDQDVTVETNSGSAPDDTFNLEAGKPLIWFSGSGFTNPFSADVTGLFITNASGVDANIQIRSLVDATP